MAKYEDFVAGKNAVQVFEPVTGTKTDAAYLMPHQKALVNWALTNGRAAIFADTGLGKTRMQLEWARHIKGGVLILAPLAVAQQTVEEGASIGIPVTLCRSDSDVQSGINIANYERLHLFDTKRFTGVVLDESSIIKHHDAKTFRLLCEAFAGTRYKLCATATPAPNDWTELATHAEFLGVCTRAEMLAEFFTHDGGETSVWRLKKHAKKAFWQFVATWGTMVRRPSDIGLSDDGYDLPALSIEHHMVEATDADVTASGLLFARPAETLMERRQARRGSLASRVDVCAELVYQRGGVWLVWCDLNAESEALVREIDGAVEVTGAMSIDEKERRLLDFILGKTRVLVTKPSIAGFGLNFQHCHNMAFVGVTDSWEAYYQAVRRCWRFGQLHPVNVHVIASELEGAVVENLKRKEASAIEMAEQLTAECRDAVRAAVTGTARRVVNAYDPKVKMEVPKWAK
jgi:hypothetical protein